MGTVTTSGFSWVQIPLGDVTLKPNHYYWVGLLPPTSTLGATDDDTGIELGATADRHGQDIA